MPKLTTTQWRARERRIMKAMGLTPTPNSGAGALWKEDGTNETYIAQLKSTQGKAIAITVDALKALLINAIRSHRIPLFVLDIEGQEPLVCMPMSHFNTLQEVFHARQEEMVDDA